MPPSEQDIQRTILSYLDSIGAYSVKIITANKRGVADILSCFQGRFYAIEVKTPKGRVSPLQEWHIAKAQQSGAIAFIARSVNDVKEKLCDTHSSSMEK